MKTETITAQHFEQEQATLFVYTDDGRMFTYIEDSGFLDIGEYVAGRRYQIEYRYEFGQAIIYSIYKV